MGFSAAFPLKVREEKTAIEASEMRVLPVFSPGIALTREALTREALTREALTREALARKALIREATVRSARAFKLVSFAAPIFYHGVFPVRVI